MHDSGPTRAFAERRGAGFVLIDDGEARGGWGRGAISRRPVSDVVTSRIGGRSASASFVRWKCEGAKERFARVRSSQHILAKDPSELFLA